MDFVLAKVKHEGSTPYWKLMSNKTLFEKIDIDKAECVVYDPDHNLDEGCWFKIEGFSNTSYCLNILKTACDSKEFNNVKRNQFTKIDHLIGIQGKDFYFQSFTKNSYICHRLISFGDIGKFEDNVTRIIIKNLPDAVYFKDKDILIFRKLASITSIFKKINALYREATELEVATFLKSSFIKLGSEYNTGKVSIYNRKRISMALEILAGLSTEEKNSMFKYMDSYSNSKIVFDEEKIEFEINSDENLKILLYGINERFYTTAIGKEQRIANSVVKF